MSFEVVLADPASLDRASVGKEYLDRIHVTEADIQRWSELLGEPRSTLYDQIATYLARGFHSSELTFEFCDAIVNDIHGVITSVDEIRPDLFWQVYLAFDEGEYYHDDKRDEDPSEVYTRPLIAEIVTSLSAP